MLNRLKYNHETIIIIGDIHGEFKTLNWEIHKRRKIENALLIQLGDFGVGFRGDDMITICNFNDELKKHNNILVAIRGNHDNPSWFNGDFIYSNLKLVPDYTVIETTKGIIVCIGGAASIDKNYRTPDKTWWAGEIPKFDLDVLKELEKINISHVMAHTNPSFCYPHMKSPLMKEDIIAYEKKSRKIITMNYHYLKSFHNIQNWWSSHYHWHHEQTIKNTKFTTLDIMEFKEFLIN